jgi:hypothetical protein
MRVETCAPARDCQPVMQGYPGLTQRPRDAESTTMRCQYRHPGNVATSPASCRRAAPLQACQYPSAPRRLGVQKPRYISILPTPEFSVGSVPLWLNNGTVRISTLPIGQSSTLRYMLYQLPQGGTATGPRLHAASFTQCAPLTDLRLASNCRDCARPPVVELALDLPLPDLRLASMPG